MQHKSDQKRTVSISEAAKALGLHRSTLLRQLKKGVFPNRNGRVNLAEVEKGRAENLHQNRGDRWSGGRGFDATDGAPTMSDATKSVASYSDIRAALVKIVSLSEEKIAIAAVAAGASLAVAYATSIIGRMEIQGIADEMLLTDDFIELKEGFDGPIKAPNWDALAALAGEAVDLEAWKAYCAARPWWKD